MERLNEYEICHRQDEVLLMELESSVVSVKLEICFHNRIPECLPSTTPAQHYACLFIKKVCLSFN